MKHRVLIGNDWKGWEKRLRRIGAFILTILLITNMISIVSAEAKTEIKSYNFDLRFHLEPQEYSFRIREHMRGYEELSDILELKGNVSWCEETDSIEIYAELIPVTNSSAKIWVRLFGKSSCMCIESPLLGSEPYYLSDTYMIMYFFSSFWTVTGIPLPTLSLLNPNVTICCLQDVAATWTNQIPELSDGQRITVEQLESIRDIWKGQMQGNKWFLFWMDGIYAAASHKEPIEEALQTLPDVLINTACGEELIIREEDGVLRCENSKRETLFEIKSGENGHSFSLSLPNTGTKYKPTFFFAERSGDGKRDLSLHATWDRNEMAESEAEFDSLLKFRLEVEGIPESYPTDSTIMATFSTGGYTFPEINWRIQLDTDADGNVELSISQPTESGEKPLFRCFGTVTPAMYEGVLMYDVGDLSKYTYLLVANHTLISDLVKDIAPYFANGIMDFLYELPVRSCQSIMDDLESYGLLLTLMQGL